MKLHLLSGDELRSLAADIEQEKERRERARVESEFIADRTKALEKIAAEYGVIPFEDMPTGAHLPGQVVVFGGLQYRNASGWSVSTAPGTPVDPWVLLPGQEAPVEVPAPSPVEEPPADESPAEEPSAGEPPAEPETPADGGGSSIEGGTP